MILRVALALLSLHKETLLACQDFAQLCTAMKVCTFRFQRISGGSNSVNKKVEPLTTVFILCFLINIRK